MADLDPESLNKLRVVDLREHLSSRGLSTSGLKADLVKRLRDALENEANGADNSEVAGRSERSYDSSDDNSADVEMYNEGELTFEEKSNVEERLRIEQERKIKEEKLQLEQHRKAEEERLWLEQKRQAEEERLRLERIRKAEEERLQLEQDRKDEEERLWIEQERKAAEQRLRLEKERKAEEERLQLARERKAEEERLQLERDRKAEEERLWIEQERKAAEQRLRLERERKAEEERLRLVRERKAEEERMQLERERKAEEEQLRLEKERKVEEDRLRMERQRKAEEDRLRFERERKAEEDRLRFERERKAEEDRLRFERQRKAEEDRLRFERERKAEEDRLRMEQERKAEEDRLRIELERKAEEERIRMEQERKAEEERIRMEQERKAEEGRLRMEQERKAEEGRLRLERERKVEEERLRLERERKVEEERLRLERERKAAEERLRIERERKASEERQKLEEERKADEERLRLEQEKKAERRRVEEAEMQREQERWLVEEQMKRAQEEHKKRLQAEEQKRVLEEQQRLMEEELEKQNSEHQLFQLQENDTDSQTEMNTDSYVTISSAINIIPPPPTVLLSNIPPPNSMIPTPPPAFPIPIPVNISAPPAPAQPFITHLSQETNSSTPTIEIISVDEVIENMDTIENDSIEIKLPQALEKVLALKTERAQQLGIDPDAVVQPIPVAEDKTSNTAKSNVVTLVSVDEDEYADEEDRNKKSSKSRRRKKKKKKKQNKVQLKNESNKRTESLKPKEAIIDVDIEYVQEVIDITDPMYAQFMKIFEKFKLTEGEKEKDETPADSKEAGKEETLNLMAFRKKPIDLIDDDDDDEDQDEDKKEEDKPKLSKRKLKKLSRMTVAELKQKVCRPELVEMHDVTAKDPVLLLHLKASRNTVPVPRHWCFKRKYLQGKRGIEKPAFELPDFIKRTGIMEMRQALQEKEDQKTMKAKMRERVRPKLGKIDIDYQKLHDAFFKWQTKPRMTIHGDLYYEGKEFETRLKEKKPGDLSDDLRTALGMPTGPNANKCPPPWLIAMQRYGPPPSYPNLKIPGLNAPIPDSCSFGYHAGGWGKPPVDETGRPLYGDVFGTQISDNQPNIQEEEIDHTLWGELESESSEEEEEEDEEEEEEEEEKQEDETGLVTPAEGLITPSGFSSIPAGMETPDMIELRKRKIEAEKEGGETPALYTILPEKKNERIGAAMMGSTHTYDLAGAIPASKLRIPGTASVVPQGIEVALDPSELEMDSAAMAARYEQTMREQQSQLEKEDLSDMVAEHAARQKNKRKKQQLDSAKPPKKYKEFKF